MFSSLSRCCKSLAAHSPPHNHLLKISLRVQVPNNHILTPNLYYNYYYPNPKYLIIGYMDPLGFTAETLPGKSYQGVARSFMFLSSSIWRIKGLGWLGCPPPKPNSPTRRSPSCKLGQKVGFKSAFTGVGKFANPISFSNRVISQLVMYLEGPTLHAVICIGQGIRV